LTAGTNTYVRAECETDTFENHSEFDDKYRAYTNPLWFGALSTLVVPYLNDTESYLTFMKITNTGTTQAKIDVELMDDSGNTDTAIGFATINPNSTALIWASDITQSASKITGHSFAAKLNFKNVDMENIHGTCIMKSSDGQRVMPVYKTDSPLSTSPAHLFTPYLNRSSGYNTYVKINNWSDGAATVQVKLRSNDGATVKTISLTSISAHSTGLYWANVMGDAAGLSDASFSAEFIVSGPADKIFGVVCQKSSNGQRVLPLYKNASTTSSDYGYYSGDTNSGSSQTSNLVVPYLNGSSSYPTFIKITNTGTQSVSVNSELMDDTGNKQTLNSVVSIAANATGIIWASALSQKLLRMNWQDIICFIPLHLTHNMINT